jgi:hypothetical protein
MSFEKIKFENPSKDLEKKENNEESENKLKKFLEQISARLKSEGIFVTEECRIDMQAYRGVYPEDEIENDDRLIKEYQKEWYKGSSENEIKEQKIKKTGEKLEMLKTAIFSKFLGEEFIVVRASLYDDIKNKVDNIILEKNSGNLVCALDEVESPFGQRYEEKKEKVLSRNKTEGGIKLKYGFFLEKDKDNKERIALGEISNVPLFYLVLPAKHVEEGIKQLIPDISQKSDYEKRLFKYFITSLSSQIDLLRLETKANPTLEKRLDYFEKIIERFKERK